MTIHRRIISCSYTKFFCSFQALHIEYEFTHILEVICFIQICINLYKYCFPSKSPQNNVWPTIWAPCGPVKLTYKINHMDPTQDEPPGRGSIGPVCSRQSMCKRPEAWHIWFKDFALIQGEKWWRPGFKQWQWSKGKTESVGPGDEFGVWFDRDEASVCEQVGNAEVYLRATKWYQVGR